ncbi:MAG: NAD-dependent epimerase/dehydratase family protein [Planctomycetes bacterium]|nr:NAD-dependent epimerase/dehydratase family protein [Planctomycetota bacterium]MCH9724501.1 NAD-dependent epimerase/dehydratase family protein [Planctomycetota bacterium]MCH9774840.1 NAD-dependent epimerase/dehydratase family protein [Planctomycetota bacterium]MCH9792835.1 NAD-dependent epimerase/dehydratase family protein [Planctomycetota bacterium]
MTNLPATIDNIEQLDELLSRPTPQVLSALKQTEGDLILLGIAGKMGPTLARMILRSDEETGTRRRIYGVSRFSDESSRQPLEYLGIETLKGDLLDADFINSLPDVPHVIYMAGMKFGATGNESLTWAMNTYLPALVCNKYRNSRITAFSTGNVYGLVNSSGQGSVETDKPDPVGEYAMSCLGRERMFEHFSRTLNIPMTFIRLNYAVECRYGVLVDLALQVYQEKTIDVSMGYVNVIWQGDANAMTLCSLPDATSPPSYLNVAGPQILSVRKICERFGTLFDKPLQFSGTEAEDALINNGQFGHHRYSIPQVDVEQMTDWIADWIKNDRPLLGKPTHFESRSGKF